MDRDDDLPFVEDEDAYQECFEDTGIDAERELDFGFNSSDAEPSEGLYEGQEHELSEALDKVDSEDDPDPFLDDLLGEYDGGERVEIDFNELFISGNSGD